MNNSNSSQLSTFLESVQQLFFNFDLVQNIYNVMAILGFCASAFLCVRVYINSRKNIAIKVVDYNKHDHVVQFFLCIQNNSDKPLCIDSIEIPNGVQCELIPKKITDKLSTPMFPLNLSGHQGSFYFLEFLYCADIELAPGKTIVFLVHTNRGQIETSLTLGNISYYLHTREQYLQSQQLEKS